MKTSLLAALSFLALTAVGCIPDAGGYYGPVAYAPTPTYAPVVATFVSEPCPPRPMVITPRRPLERPHGGPAIQPFRAPERPRQVQVAPQPRAPRPQMAPQHQTPQPTRRPQAVQPTRPPQPPHRAMDTQPPRQAAQRPRR
jgi:hypothetical protein